MYFPLQIQTLHILVQSVHEHPPSICMQIRSVKSVHSVIQRGCRCIRMKRRLWNINGINFKSLSLGRHLTLIILTMMLLSAINPMHILVDNIGIGGICIKGVGAIRSSSSNRRATRGMRPGRGRAGNRHQAVLRPAVVSMMVD